ncbi:MAG: cytochrome c oxidase subunit 3 [Spirochaetia bacterium]|nr:cytochrome c oxidase subunit 3 [Spirochaetia bacterium]
MVSLKENKKTTNQSTVITNGALGMILFVATEIMFFSGLISAFVVNASDNIGAWPPKWQPRLPVEATAVNTLILFASAITLFFAIRKTKSKTDGNFKTSSNLLKITMLLGGTFVALQGFEWVQLIGAGLTSSSSLFGAFFYTIIGMHGIHALAGVIYLFVISLKIIKSFDSNIKMKMMQTLSIYWFFVVLLWPVLYLLVYVLPSKG